MLYVLRRQIVFFTLIFYCLSVHAQRELNRPGHDLLPYYFGLSLSYNNSFLHAEKHPLFLQNDSILSVEPGASGGLALGLAATANLAPHFELRFLPQLILGGSKYFTYTLKYPTELEPAVQKKVIPSTIVSFPLQLKFNSDRIDNFRVYMLGGLKYDYDLASNSSARNAEDLVKLAKSEFGYEAGIGFNFFLPVVTVSPEFKVSNGLSNVHSRDPNLKYSNVMDQIQSHMFVFSIILEQ
jgi:hypothetical protein